MRTFLIFLACLISVLSFANGFERDDDIIFSKKDKRNVLRKERKIIVRKVDLSKKQMDFELVQ
jgi:hypothetical protein